MTLTGSKGEERLTVPEFHRVTEGPVLGLEAVPWAEPRPVVKGYGLAADQIEVRPTIIHPSVIQADPLGEAAPAPWLMYYAPHHSPGIGVAGAERLAGPWRPLGDHAVLRLEQFTGLSDHLSGPDVLWVPEENRLRMYCHGVVPGEGQQTGVAVSADGLHFEPLHGGPILPYPYLRVFRRDRSWYVSAAARQARSYCSLCSFSNWRLTIFCSTPWRAYPCPLCQTSAWRLRISATP